MNKLFFGLIMLIIFLPSININFDTRSNSVDRYSLMANEGMVAMQYAYTINATPSTDTHKPNECDCKGTGRLRSGDGLVNLPCPCDVCGCKKSVGRVAQVKKQTQIVFVTAPNFNCNPCNIVKNLFFPYMRASGWRIGGLPTDHILISTDTNKYPVDAFPTFIVFKDGQEFDRFTLDETGVPTNSQSSTALANKIKEYFDE